MKFGKWQGNMASGSNKEDVKSKRNITSSMNIYKAEKMNNRKLC